MQLVEGLIILFVLCPISLLIHEIGHALGIVIADKNAVAQVYMGSASEDNKFRLKVGRIHLYLTLAFSGFCSFANEQQPISNRQRLLMLTGGPVMSLLTCLLLLSLSYWFWSVGNVELSSWFENVGFINFIIFILTVLPYKYPSFMKHLGGFPTDGLQILKLLRNRATLKNEL